MINTITRCLLDANDHAYILLSNEIEALQPSLNLAEFGESTVNIGIFCVVVLIIILIISIKKKGFNKSDKIFSMILGGFSLFVFGNFLYFQHDISEIETEISMLNKDLAKLEQPSTEIVKACVSEGIFLQGAESDEILILKNKDDSPSTYSIVEK